MIPSASLLRPSPVFITTTLLLLIAVVISSSSSSPYLPFANAATVKAWDSTVALDVMDAVRICTPASSTTKVCYRNVFGSFYFSCTTASEQVSLYMCTENDCATCTAPVGVTNPVANFLASTPSTSYIEGKRTYNWSGVVYTSSLGYITQQYFSEKGCAVAGKMYRDYHPQSTAACLKFGGYATSSQRWYCSGTLAYRDHYLVSGTCAAGTNVTSYNSTTGACCENCPTFTNKSSWTCESPGGTLNIVAFKKSGVVGFSGLGSVLVGILMLVVVALFWV